MRPRPNGRGRLEKVLVVRGNRKNASMRPRPNGRGRLEPLEMAKFQAWLLQ